MQAWAELSNFPVRQRKFLLGANDQVDQINVLRLCNCKKALELLSRKELTILMDLDNKLEKKSTKGRCNVRAENKERNEAIDLNRIRVVCVSVCAKFAEKVFMPFLPSRFTSRCSKS